MAILQHFCFHDSVRRLPVFNRKGSDMEEETANERTAASLPSKTKKIYILLAFDHHLSCIVLRSEQGK
jgi:hypothetical protein